MTPKRSRILVVATVAMVLMLCTIAAVTYWMVSSSPECWFPDEGPAEPGWSARKIASGDRERCYQLYVPSDYDPTQPVPLVVSYHGFLSSPNANSVITRWHKLAEQEGFIVVFPQATGFPQAWNAGPTWGRSDVDDVQFFVDLLDEVSSLAAIDSSRIYANGFSNGGGMTVRLGCEVTDKIAAMGSVAGAIVTLEDCAPSRPLPTMAFHSTADPLVPYKGGDMESPLLAWLAGWVEGPVYFVGAEEWVATWAGNNGCNPLPEGIPPQGDVRGIRYVECDADAEVVFYTIEDGGHAWPGGMPLPGVGKTSKDIKATEEMWQFFQKYRLDE